MCNKRSLKVCLTIASATVMLGMGWALWRCDVPAVPRSENAVAEKGATVLRIPEVKPETVATHTSEEGGRHQNKLMCGDDDGKVSAEASCAEKGEDMADVKDAPRCPTYPDTPVHAYRTARLAPKSKGGAEGELREWLVKPDPEGYEYHVEEEYYPNEEGEMELVATREYVANQVTLMIDGEVQDADFAARVAKFGCRFKDTLMSVDKGKRIVAVDIPEISFDAVAKIEQSLASVSGASGISKDFVRHSNTTPAKDPLYVANYQWGLKKINAPGAWDIVNDASSVVVAVLDTGINYNHEDLSGNMWVNPSMGGQGFGSADRYGARCVGGVKSGDPLDDNDHGSNCAGIIGMVGNNNKGGAGVAWKVKLMALKCFSSSGSSTTVDSDSVALLAFARDKGANIVSCSLGGYGYSATMYAAFAALRTSGIVAVCAAGNDAYNTDSTPNYPSSFDLDNIVSVAAVNSSDALCTKAADNWAKAGSNWGVNSVDIAAPGNLIYSASAVNATTYCGMSGTSQATPFVSGVMALLKAKHPNETYLQLIQRLYNGADTVSALSGKVAGARRLNALKPLTLISAPQISASKGTYSDKIRVAWRAVSGASYYRVYRATSPTGTKTALGSSWQTATTYNDTTAVKGTMYYYFAKSATSSSGANASDYSAYDTGWMPLSVTYPDAWDPNDDTITGTTNVLSMSTTVRTQSHKLSASDIYDFAKVYLTSGKTYVFETTGSCSVSGGDGDLYGELFSTASTNASYCVAYADDIAYPSNFNYRLTYTPTSTGYYYLRTRTYTRGKSASYTLRYQRKISSDSWDPTDDTASGATALTPTTTVQTHGTHTLTDTDKYDWFKISMTAGRTYTFESSCTDGCYDMYGELYDSTLATDAHRVAYNDDGGSQSLQFKISYTPTTTGTYYLRVRRYTVGAVGVYSLKYSVSVPNTHDLVFCRNTSWSSLVFLSNVTNATCGATEFTTNDTIHVTYGFLDNCNNDVAVRFTNTVQLVKYASADATTYTVLGAAKSVFPNMRAGTWWADRSIEIGRPTPGYYGVRVELNCPRNITETNYVNNVRIARYTVTAPQPDLKRLTELAISAGPATIVGGETAQYSATASFSDGSTLDVTASATWSCANRVVSSVTGGRAETQVVQENATATLQVGYTHNGVSKQATKTVTITPEPIAVPIGPSVVYPITPMTVYAQVYLDDVKAEAGDVLGAYVGDECRGYLELRTGGKGPINIYVTSPSERITFKCWSPRFEGDRRLFVCSTQLAGEIGGELGSPSQPHEIRAYGNDPFSTPSQYPNPPMTIVAKVVIKGQPASSGDMVGVFCGTELRGKGAVRVDGGIAKITLVASVKTAGEKLTFKVWDASASELLNVMGSVTAVVGGELGSPESRHLIQVAETVTQAISLTSSTWQFVSFNVTPSNPAPNYVFAELASDIDRVTCGDKVYKPTWSDANNTLGDIEVGSGYWVKRKTSGTKMLSASGAPGDVTATSIRLSAGWNSVGYVPQQAGNVRTVLANALSAGLVERVTSGDEAFNPTWPDEDNTLTVMTPGRGYWIKAKTSGEFVYVEPSGGEAAQALAVLSDAGEPAHPFGEDRDRDVTAGVILQAKLDLWGTDAVYGDAYVAAYANGSQLPCAVGYVNLNGSIVMNITKIPAFNLTFKVWDSIAKRLYDSSTVISFAAGEDEKENQVIAVSGPAPMYQVVFDLVGESGGSGVRTGGGALTQSVQRAASAVAPTVAGNPGYEFYLWDCDFSKIKCDTTVRAIYSAADPDPLPEMDNPTSEEIAAVLEAAADERLSSNITNASEYTAFRTWSGTVKCSDGSSAGGAGVMAAENAWISYALGSDTLLQSAPTDADLSVEAFEATATAGRFDFSVSVNNVAVGGAAQTDAQKECVKANLKEVIGLEGGTDLTAEGMSSKNVDITFDVPEDGKVKFTAGPSADKADVDVFFMRVRVK